jgi:uncharacterized protein
MKKIVIAGGTGLIGTRLSQLLKQAGHTVVHLSRKANPNAAFPTFAWQPEKGIVDKNALADADAIVNLAGAGIADKHWTSRRKKEIIDSRVDGNVLIANYLQTEKHSIKTYVSASAIGFYGNRGSQIMTETDSAGTGFLSESTVAWEQGIEKVAATGIRTVALRVGIVMSKDGGALEKMLIPFALRQAVYFGNGEQYMSWVHIDDVCRMFQWAIDNPEAQGTYNAVAPTPLSNLAVTKAIAAAKGGFFLTLPAPAFALRLGMGEMADVVLGSTRVSSQKIENQGFKFDFPNLDGALKDILKTG